MTTITRLRVNFWTVGILLAAFSIGFCGGELRAQSTNASVTGYITDPSKAVIVGAKVIVINVDTNVRYEGTTNSVGSYDVPALPPGHYRIEVEKPGFKTVVKSDLILHVQDTAAINFEMALGSASEIVTVRAGGLNINTESAAISTVMDRSLIENLPLNGNSLQTLFELTPGVVTNAGGSQNYGGGFSVNGQRSTSNYLQVDGAGENIYVPGAQSGQAVMGSGVATSASGGTNGLLPVDAIEEYRIQTSSYSAEYGRTPGGQISIKTRGGTNQFHGSLFENFRNQVMDAQDFFIGYDNRTFGANLTQAPLRMNDFGGTLGGPLLKDRLFFFVAHESLFMNQPQQPTSTDVPDAATRSTAASAFQPYLNVFPRGNTNSSQCVAMGRDPACDLANPGSDIYDYSVSNLIRDHSTSFRVDAALPRGLQVFFRLNDAPSYLELPNPVNAFRSNINILTATSGLTWQISPKLFDQFTFNYSSNRNSTVVIGTPKAYLQTVSQLADPSTLSVEFIGFQWPTLEAGGGSSVGQLHQINAVDTFTSVIGSHTLMAGVDFRRYDPSLLPLPAFLQLYTNFSSTSVQSGTLDAVLYGQVNNPPRISAMNTSLFVNDSWKAGGNLTLNFGLRWEYNPPPSASTPGLLAMTGDPNNPSAIGLAPAGVALYKTRYNNFAPRIGFAYSMHGGRFETVLRGGGGIFFDTGQAASASQAALVAYPYQVTTPEAFGIPYSAVNVDQLKTQAASGLPQNQLFLTDPNLRSPRTYGWSLTLDQRIGADTGLSTSYIGNVGDDLVKESTYHGLSPSFADTLYVFANGEHSSYNALQTQIRHRESSRLSLVASYTFAHAIDNGSSDFVGVGGFLKNYRANSDNDIRHVFSLASHYSPGGIKNNRFLKGLTSDWSIDPLVLLQSALPLSVYSSTAVNPDQFNEYADIVPGMPTTISDPSVPGGKRLNPAAFVAAPGTRDGTSARNGYRLFGLKQFDLGISRSWPLREQVRMSFSVEAFNVFNSPNFANVDTFLPDRTFGEATATYANTYGGGTNLSAGGLNSVFSNGGARSLQLALKIKF